MSEENKIIRVGSRKSELALIQTKYVIACLQKLFPAKIFEIHTMTTMGDRILNQSLPKIGEKSLFTKDLEDALRNGGVDFVVHSLKDLPTSLPCGMAIGAVLEREDPRDALVLNDKYKGQTLKTLPKGSIIGTSSLRRSAQLAREYTHLVVCDIRGNLNTRLAKLDAENSKFAGIILAQAGLVRMGWQKRISQVLEPSEILYAVGQGALAVECRSNDHTILDMLSLLSCLETQCKILAERSFLKTLGGGCSAPVAVCTNFKRKSSNYDCEIALKGAVWSLDGKTKIESDVDCCFDLNNEEDNEVTPRKKQKTDDDSANGNDYKRKSPDIIDDSKAAILKNTLDGSGGDQSDMKNLDIEAIINIHGELFKKCPYSLQHHQDKLKVQCDGGGEKSTDDGCPLQIPIGEDFMGSCPYVSTKEKVDYGEKCPITGKKSTEKIEENNKQAKCPFTAVRKSIDQLTSSDKCPFLTSHAVPLIDYDLNKKHVEPKLVDDSDTLFCGMAKHKSVKCMAFEACQKLGIQLAENLIKRGALEVMKIAQQEIRGDQPKVPQTI